METESRYSDARVMSISDPSGFEVSEVVRGGRREMRRRRFRRHDRRFCAVSGGPGLETGDAPGGKVVDFRGMLAASCELDGNQDCGDVERFEVSVRLEQRNLAAEMVYRLDFAAEGFESVGFQAEMWLGKCSWYATESRVYCFFGQASAQETVFLEVVD